MQNKSDIQEQSVNTDFFLLEEQSLFYCGSMILQVRLLGKFSQGSFDLYLYII